MSKALKNPNKCSLVHAVNLIGGKWKPLILHKLSRKSVRFGILLYLLPGISRKVLAERLREMEEEGLISKQKFAELPPRVEYGLTDKGRALMPILKLLSVWVITAYPQMVFEEFEL